MQPLAGFKHVVTGLTADGHATLTHCAAACAGKRAEELRP